MSEYKSGAELLDAFEDKTREQKLERAVKALMDQLEYLHGELHLQSLADNINNKEMHCSCADAYRMGHEALK